MRRQISDISTSLAETTIVTRDIVEVQNELTQEMINLANMQCELSEIVKNNHEEFECFRYHTDEELFHTDLKNRRRFKWLMIALLGSCACSIASLVLSIFL